MWATGPFVLGTVILAATAVPVAPEGDDLGKKLDVKVTEYAVSAESFLEALTEVAARFEIPMGIEWERTRRCMAKVRLSWRNATVRQVIVDVTKTQPDYDSEPRDGIVHVFSRKVVGDRRNFLNLRMARFEARNQSVNVVDHRLRLLTQRMMLPPDEHSAKGGMGVSIASGAGDRPVTFEMQDASVRDILNKLSLGADFKVWIVTFVGDRSVAPGGFWRTTYPLAGKPIPDDAQPFWELLMWRQSTYP